MKSELKAMSGRGGKPYEQFFYFHEEQTTYVERLRAILGGLGLATQVRCRKHCAEVIAHSLALGQLPIVLQQHAHAALQAFLRDQPVHVGMLVVRQRDARGVHAVVLRRPQ